MKLKSTVFLFILAVFAFTFVFSSELLPSKNSQKDYSAEENKLMNEAAGIFQQNCSKAGCHRGTRPPLNLSLERDKFLSSLLNVPSKEIPSLKLVNTENPGESYLLKKIKGDEAIAGKRMPLRASPLKEEEIKTIEEWISSLKRDQLGVEKTIKQN